MFRTEKRRDSAGLSYPWIVKSTAMVNPWYFYCVDTVAVWRRPTPELLGATGGAWLLFNAVHFLWHALHLDVFSTADRVGNLVALGGALILSILLLLPDREVSRSGSVRGTH